MDTPSKASRAMLRQAWADVGIPEGIVDGQELGAGQAVRSFDLRDTPDALLPVGLERGGQDLALRENGIPFSLA